MLLVLAWTCTLKLSCQKRIKGSVLTGGWCQMSAGIHYCISVTHVHKAPPRSGHQSFYLHFSPSSSGLSLSEMSFGSLGTLLLQPETH